MSDQELAKRIAEMSSLDYETALHALEAGGRPRELALSILDTEDKYRPVREEIAEAREKLRERVPA